MSDAENAGGEWVGRWRVAAVGPVAAPERVVATLTLTDDGQVSGHGGVNSFSGRYARVGERLEFGPLMATLMAGPGPAGDFESRLLTGLRGRCEVRTDGTTLRIGHGDTQIRCERM